MALTSAFITGTLAAAVCAVAAVPDALAAQTDTTVVVVAGEEYAAGSTKRLLLGEDYRDLWTTPIRVPILNLQAFAGGLEPVRLGGGKQTRVLHMRNTEGREFVFRSVNKDPALAEEPSLENTIVSRIVQDQVSSLHPASAAVVPPLLEAVGVMHASPVLVVMPDDAALGEFREEFAGILGWVEERPDEVKTEGEEDRPGFEGYERITATDRLLERIEETPEHRADARTFLTARMVDLIIGDWDRHYDQWRWAEEEDDGFTRWVPIPRDRDYAFVRYDGRLIRVASLGISNLVVFQPRIADVSGLTLNARDLDRRLLTGLSVADWDSIAGFVQSRLTDEVIADAVARVPEEYHELSGEWLTAALRGRRDDLPRAARAFYAQLATDVDVRATDEDDVAVIDRLADHVVRVRLHAREDDSRDPAGAPYYERTFYGSETDEVRVFLHGGDDYALVRGDVNRSLMVRVIGGGGDDEMRDSSRVVVNRGQTRFYDARGSENRLIAGWGTSVDTREWEEPEEGWTVSGDQFRDWGETRSISPVIDYRGTDGLIVGGGPVHTRYGFRSFPYEYRIGARARIGLKSFKPAVEIFGDVRRENSPWGYGFHAEASRLENFRFFGFGNDTEAVAETSRYTVSQDQIAFRLFLDRQGREGFRFRLGPSMMYTNPDVADDSPIGELPRYGNRGFGQVGGEMDVALDRRDNGAFPRSGFLLRGNADVYPVLWSASRPFGSFGGTASAYFSGRFPIPATLALRGGAKKAWGEFPVHESAFVGGSRSLRGYTYQRFAGDGSAFGNAELRVPLTTAVLLVRGTLGALALADAGRVWYDGESEGGWHTAAGGGLWFEFELRGHALGLTALYAEGGEDGRFYLKLGAPF